MSWIKTACRHALQHRLFEPYFQPLHDIRQGGCVGAEILARLPHAEYGLVMPGAFLPELDTRESLSALTQIILEKTATWLMANTLPPGFILTFNISADMTDAPWLAGACNRLAACAGNRLTVVAELTERQPLTRYGPEWQRHRHTLKENGVLLALDDFGTGCSGLHLLQQTEAEILKLPREFVMSLEESVVAASVTDMVIQLADQLGLQVIAEGVETKAQRDLLAAKGVRLMQGFYFSPALSSDDFIYYPK